MPQEDNPVFEKPSCQGEYVEDLLKSPRDFPSSPLMDSRASLPAELGRRRADLSVKGIWMVTGIHRSMGNPAGTGLEERDS